MESLQIGIRLHDVNAALSSEKQTMEARAATAREEGFRCVHLALQKVIRGVTFDSAALTEGLAWQIRHVFDAQGLDIAVLGCYLNLATPDEEQLREFQARYVAHMRVASLCGACLVGTETGAPNTSYRLDANTHSDAALKTFLYNLEPVMEAAEHYGVSFAIEPVWNHIVYDAGRALEVLRSIGSSNLRIIFDPVNLLSFENADDREAVINDAMEKLCDHIALVHLKDFVRQEGKLISVAAGDGEMDFRSILRFLKARKPFIQATLENTTNENAVRSREWIQRLYQEA